MSMKTLIIQPFLPNYTLPLFERIAHLPGVELTVLADLQTKNQLNQYDASRDHFKALHLGRRPVGGIVFRPGIFSLLVNLHPEVVIIGGDPREVSQAVVLIWCKYRKIPVGVWSMFHRIGKKRLFTELYMRFVGRFGDLMLSYGNRGKSEQVKRGVPDEKVVVLSTALDESKIIKVRDSITKEDIQDFRRTKRISDKKLLLHVVRLTAIKRPDIMVRCFARLAETRNDVELIWIGGGPLEDETKELAHSLGILERMRFLGPLYDEHELGLWYKSSTVFVMATCIGLSIHHAMCYGLPVVTDDNESTQTSEFEVLIDGVNGLTYRSGDFDDFAEKVSRILDDADFHSQLSFNAIKRIEDEYTLDKKVENFAAAIWRLKSLRNAVV